MKVLVSFNRSVLVLSFFDEFIELHRNAIEFWNNPHSPDITEQDFFSFEAISKIVFSTPTAAPKKNEDCDTNCCVNNNRRHVTKLMARTCVDFRHSANYQGVYIEIY